MWENALLVAPTSGNANTPSTVSHGPQGNINPMKTWENTLPQSCRNLEIPTIQ